MEGHDSYFSWVVAIIPRDLYKTSGDEEAELSSKYYKHRKVPLKPEEKKAISKAKKREVYSSREGEDGERNEMEVEREGECEGQGDEDEEEEDGQGVLPRHRHRESGEYGDGDETDMVIGGGDGDNAHNSLESLRQRLQKRILGLQTLRKGGGGDNKAFSKVDKKRDTNQAGSASSSKHTFSNEHRNVRGEKRSSFALEIESNHSSGDLSSSKEGGSWSLLQEQSQHQKIAATKENDRDVDADIDVDVDVNNFLSTEISMQKKDSLAGKPGTKMVRLKRMLNEATKKRQRLESLAQEGEQGKKRAKEEAWTDALKSASGEKLTFDAARLKKAIKRREKQKERSADEWRDRKDSIEETKNAKAEKREANILQRKQGGSGGNAALLQSQSQSQSQSHSGSADKEREGGGRRNKFTERLRNDRIEEKKAAGDSKNKRPGFEGKKGVFLNSKRGSGKN